MLRRARRTNSTRGTDDRDPILSSTIETLDRVCLVGARRGALWARCDWCDRITATALNDSCLGERVACAGCRFTFSAARVPDLSSLLLQSVVDVTFSRNVQKVTKQRPCGVVREEQKGQRCATKCALACIGFLHKTACPKRPSQR